MYEQFFNSPVLHSTSFNQCLKHLASIRSSFLYLSHSTPDKDVKMQKKIRRVCTLIVLAIETLLVDKMYVFCGRTNEK